MERCATRLQSRTNLACNLAYNLGLISPPISTQGPQLQFIKAKDEVLDQAPVYGFTIPVFGEGIIYDSPLEERQQQVSAP